MSAGTKVLGLVNETMSSLSSIKIKVSELRLFLMVLVLSAPRRMDKSVSALKWSDKLDSVLRCIHPNGWILTWQRGGAFQSSLATVARKTLRGVSPSVGLLSHNNNSTRYAVNLQTTQTPDSVIARIAITNTVLGFTEKLFESTKSKASVVA